MGLSLLATLFVDPRHTSGPGAEIAPNTAHTISQVFHDPIAALSLGSTAAILFTDSVSTSFLPVFLQQVGLSVAAIGLLLSLHGLASMCVRPTITALTRHVNRWRLVLAAMAAEAVGTAIVPVFPVMPVLMLASMLCGAATGYNQPLGMAIISDRVPTAQRSMALALRLGGNRLAGLVGPLLLGVVSNAAGLPTVFWCAGLVAAVSAAWVAGFQRRGGEAAVRPWGSLAVAAAVVPSDPAPGTRGR